MPICEICGIEVESTETCSECQSKYCTECGDNKQKLCYDCLGWTEDPEDEWLDEDLN